MVSEVRYEIKNFITCYLTWNFDTKKIRVGSYATNWTTDPGWSGWRWRCWRDSSTDWSSKLLTMRSKEKKDYYSSDHYFYWSSLYYFTFGWQSELIQIFLMWSQIYVLLSIRLTGGRQTGFKDLKPLKAKKIF